MNLTEWLRWRRRTPEKADAWVALFDFARAFARTSGDSPSCECVSCRAHRAVRVLSKEATP